MIRSEVFNRDCMEAMKEYPDNYFDLAVVDPPYGIDNKISTKSTLNKGNKFAQLYNEKRWDKFRPNIEYWNELLRVSKNQIVFGGNYFSKNLPVSRGWIFWDKQGEGMTSVNDELIWSSFDLTIKTFSRCHGRDKGFMAKGTDSVFHPTQKPVALYDWIFKNYATEGMKILDTHLGSQSSRISAYKYKMDFTGYEMDKDYFDQGCKRFEDFKSQLRLF